MRAFSFVLTICACGNAPSRPGDAGADVRSDASTDDALDALIDAAVDVPGATGPTIGGSALGVRGSVVLTLTTPSGTQHAIVNDDGAFEFPAGVAEGSTFTVTTTDACEVAGGAGTVAQSDITSVEVLCSGIVELASVTFASGNPAVAFTSALTPGFDPSAYAYIGTRPFFMDDTDMLAVTPVASYPTLPSISVYTDATTSGQPSPLHALGPVVPVRLQHPVAFDRTYQFVLLPTTPEQRAFIKPASLQTLDEFSALALSGDVLVVGALAHGGTGAAYILRRSGTIWVEEQILQPTSDAGARAGASVAIDGDVIVIGAPLDAADNSGRAYIYRYNPAMTSWALEAGGTLSATSPASGAGCGTSVAVSGTHVIIGCPGEKGSGNKTNAGAVYMFRYDATSSTWGPDGTFKGAAQNDVLGTAVALSGTTALVGAPYEVNGSTTDAGGAHVLVRGASSWSQQGATLRGDLTTGAHFGTSVAISMDAALIGSPGEGAGQAQVFRRVAGVWSADGPALAPDSLGVDFAGFGSSVGIDGTHAVIGSPREDLVFTDSGAAHVYRREAAGWTIHAVLTGAAGRFGNSVALDGEWVAVGVPDDDTDGLLSGAVRVFR
jgi:hypothetical protein